MATKLYMRVGPSTAPFLPTTDNSGNALSNMFQWDYIGKLSTTKGSFPVGNSPWMTDTYTKSQVYLGFRSNSATGVVFVSDSFDGVSTITGSQTWTIAIAASEESSKANAYMRWCVYVWRPQTQSVVKTIVDQTTDQGNEFATAEEGRVYTFTGASGDFAPQKGDVLVIEPWISFTPSTTEAKRINFYYDGATEPTEGTSTSDAASYINYGGSSLGFTTTEELDITHFRFHEDDSSAGTTLPTAYKQIDEDNVPVIDFTADRKAVTPPSIPGTT